VAKSHGLNHHVGRVSYNKRRRVRVRLTAPSAGLAVLSFDVSHYKRGAYKFTGLP